MQDTILSPDDTSATTGALSADTLSSIDDVTYDAETGETTATFDPETQEHSMVVLELVGSRDGCDTLDLPPLYDVGDAEHLDTLFDSATATAGLSVSFRYGRYDVTVSRDSVSVSPVSQL
jgi:hypothetical protein